PGVHREDLDVEFLRSIPSRRAGGVRICLSHFPDLVRRTDFLAPDLFLAGHTHGGQICLPGRLPIIRHDTLPRHQCTGVHQIGQTWLVVNRGLGFSGLPFRAFCPAEVIEIRLARQE
ncbi:MAG: hypothetical protein ACRD15_15780, partial [Vicinamibacterales bacterium]